MTVHIHYQTDGKEVFPMLSFQKELKDSAFIIALTKRHPVGMMCPYQVLNDEETKKLISFLQKTLLKNKEELNDS